MKKVTLVMVFALASFSINGGNTLDPDPDNGCTEYAADAANAELKKYGGNGYTFISDFLYYLDLCEESDGAASDPVLL